MGGVCCSAPGNDSSAQAATESVTAPDGEVLKFLGQVQLFKRLPSDTLPTLAGCCQKVTFEVGSAIIKQHDEGNEFFVIISGGANVDVDGKEVAKLRSGDYFGENALLRDEPRSATITASAKIEALKITRPDFRALGLHEKLEFAKRGAVGGGVMKEVKVKPPSPKTPQERSLMENAVKSNANLCSMIQLSQGQVDSMINKAWKEEVPAGTEVIRQGDLDADYFYIVQEGSFEVFVSGQEGKSAEQAASAVSTIPQGASFGELALLYFAPRAATVRAKQNAILWVIDRKNFKEILMDKAAGGAQKYVEYMKKVEALSVLKDEELLDIAKNLLETTFAQGETLMAEGEKGDVMYLLVEGEVKVTKGGKEQATLKPVNIFGEHALLSDEPRTATVTVSTASARCLTIDRVSFNIMKKGVDAHKAAEGKKEESRFGKIHRKDLKRLGLLGCGGFGAVELVEHVTTQNVYALKALSKGYVVKSGMQESVMSEKNVQIMCNSTFVIMLYETFNGEQSLYLLLELAQGGELYDTYNRKDFFGKEGHAKFYIAGVTYAMDHMHSKKIIFRDLKPENVLLNEIGKCKVTDMGLAKVCCGRTFTTCGTPDYFAPEIVQSLGHTKSLDWWTVGVLTFELMAGCPPFESASPMEIYHKVVRGIDKVRFPKKAKGSVEDLIKSLCKTNPSDRLPMKSGGIANIQNHPWYNGFDWEAMKNLTLEPPYKPPIKSKKDMNNFSARKEDMPPHILYKDDGTGWDKDFATST